MRVPQAPIVAYETSAPRLSVRARRHRHHDGDRRRRDRAVLGARVARSPYRSRTVAAAGDRDDLRRRRHAGRLLAPRADERRTSESGRNLRVLASGTDQLARCRRLCNFTDDRGDCGRRGRSAGRRRSRHCGRAGDDATRHGCVFARGVRVRRRHHVRLDVPDPHLPEQTDARTAHRHRRWIARRPAGHARSATHRHEPESGAESCARPADAAFRRRVDLSGGAADWRAACGGRLARTLGIAPGAHLRQAVSRRRVALSVRHVSVRDAARGRCGDSRERAWRYRVRDRSRRGRGAARRRSSSLAASVRANGSAR